MIYHNIENHFLQNPTAPSAEDMQRILHELQVHQIELETQNIEMRRAQVELETVRARYFDLFDLAPVGYFTLNEQGIILESNLTATVMLGHPKSVLNVSPITRFILSEDQDIHYRHRKILTETGQPQLYDLRMVHENQTVLWTRLNTTIAKGDETETPIYRITAADITEKKVMEESLQRLQRLESLGCLAGGIAHDFNNLLTGLFGYLEIIKMKSHDREPVLKDIAKAMSVFDRVHSLTGQLLTFAKGGAPVKSILDLNQLLHETAKFAISGSNSSLKFELADDLQHIEADPNQIKQAVDNLLINASQAMPGGGTITIVTQNVTPETPTPAFVPAGAWVHLRISDEGTGISSAHLPYIFDPFYTTKTKGSGLGLTTSNSIITKHGGFISVDSHQGKGTSFTLYLPASTAHTTPDVQTLSPGFTQNPRVLLMDDDDAIRDLSLDFLVAAGCYPEVVSNGQQAITVYEEAFSTGKRFDLVILDLTIPGEMGGKETLQALIKIDPTVQAIVSSGYSVDPIMANPKAFGFMASLEKPYQFDSLKAVLHKVLG